MNKILIIALTLGSIFIFAFCLNIAQNKTNLKIYETAVLLCDLNNALSSDCSKFSMQTMRYRFDKEQYWQESKKIFNDEAKLTELKNKYAKIKEFNEQILKVEKVKIEQEKKDELLKDIKFNWNQKG